MSLPWIHKKKPCLVLSVHSITPKFRTQVSFFGLMKGKRVRTNSQSGPSRPPVQTPKTCWRSYNLHESKKQRRETYTPQLDKDKTAEEWTKEKTEKLRKANTSQETFPQSILYYNQKATQENLQTAAWKGLNGRRIEKRENRKIKETQHFTRYLSTIDTLL